MRTRTKVLLYIGTLLFLPVFGIISLVAIGYGYMIYDINARTEDLRPINKSVYDFCQKISLSPKFTEGPVYFRIDKGSVMVSAWKTIYPKGALAVIPVLLWPYNKTIILTEKALQGEYLDVVVAHELGHIQNFAEGREWRDFEEGEQQADAFAAEIVGSRRVLEFRLPPDDFFGKPNATVQKYLELDDKYREAAAWQFGLPPSSSWEEVRRVVSRTYNLSENVSWEDIRERRFSKGELNKTEDEKERKEWARAFSLIDTASWKEIREEVARFQEKRKNQSK